MLSIPLTYTYLTKPSVNEDKNQHIYYESPKTDANESIWRLIDTNDASGEFKQTLNSTTFTDNLPALRSVTAAINAEGQVQARLSEDRILENTLTVSLIGPGNLVSTERGRVLRSYYHVERRHIGLDSDGILNNNTATGENDVNQLETDTEISKENQGNTDRTFSNDHPKYNDSIVGPKFASYLDEIADYCGVSIFVTNFIDKIPYGKEYHSELNSESASKPYHILIYGDQDSSRFAEFKIKIILERIRGNFIDSIPLELSLQPLVAGPNLANFKYIESVTKTKFFVPEWLPELFASQVPNPNARNLNEVYITGEQFHVLAAKLMLKDIIKRIHPLVKDCVLSFAKIDLLSLRFQDSLRKMMISHGTFIQIPYLGASRAVIRVQSSSVPICNFTITELMNLTTLIYNASYWVHTGEEDDQGHFMQPNIPIDFNILDRISAGSGATIVCKNTSFDIIGFKSDTKRAVAMIKSLPLWDQCKQIVRYRVELSNEQQEFISGKKNGKIIRIINTARVFIKLLPFNEYNFYIDIYSEDPSEATNGLKLLEEELPSELAFYIPETYHKKVIGARGSTVQGIMRQCNVFIKFSSGYDINPNGYTRLKSNNVLIRCPSKNSKEMEPAKHELLEIVNDRSQEHGTTFIKLSRSHMRILLAQHTDFVGNVESTTNTIVNVPSQDKCEDIEQQLEVRGLMTTSGTAASRIKASLPEDYEFKVAYSLKFHEFVNEDEGEFYQKVVVPFRFALKIETLVYENPEHAPEEAPYHQVILSFAQENSAGLEDAIQVLTAYLRDKGLDIIERGEYHVDPIIPGVAGLNPPMNKRRRFPPSHGGHGRGGHGYDSRDSNGFRGRYRDYSSRGSSRGRFSNSFYKHSRDDHDRQGYNDSRHLHNRNGEPADSPSGMYRNEENRKISRPYRKGPFPNPPKQRRQRYQNRYGNDNNDDRNMDYFGPDSNAANSQGPSGDAGDNNDYYNSSNNNEGYYENPKKRSYSFDNDYPSKSPSSNQYGSSSHSRYDDISPNRYSSRSQSGSGRSTYRGNSSSKPYYASDRDMLNDRNRNNELGDSLPPPPPPPHYSNKKADRIPARGRYGYYDNQNFGDRYSHNRAYDEMDPLPPPPPPPPPSDSRSYDYGGHRSPYGY